MKHVLAPNNIFQRFILPGELVEFSERCKTAAKRLTAEEAAEYGVSKLKLVSPPAYDPLTQSRTDGAVMTNGEWVQVWVISTLAAEDQAAATKASIINQIAALEASITNRRIREAIRGQGKAWLDAIDDQIAALRAQLPQE